MPLMQGRKKDTELSISTANDRELRNDVSQFSAFSQTFEDEIFSRRRGDRDGIEGPAKVDVQRNNGSCV